MQTKETRQQSFADHILFSSGWPLGHHQWTLDSWDKNSPGPIISNKLLSGPESPRPIDACFLTLKTAIPSAASHSPTSGQVLAEKSNLTDHGGPTSNILIAVENIHNISAGTKESSTRLETAWPNYLQQTRETSPAKFQTAKSSLLEGRLPVPLYKQVGYNSRHLLLHQLRYNTQASSSQLGSKFDPFR